MTPEELTQFVAAQQMVLTRHDREFERINETLANTNATLDRVAAQQESTSRQTALNQEAIATLTASIQDLRNLVADYIQGRLNT